LPALAQCTSYPALRRHFHERIARAMTPRDLALSILLGDWNYVVDICDRRAASTMQATGARNLGEARHSDSPLGKPFGFFEMHQGTLRIGVVLLMVD